MIKLKSEEGKCHLQMEGKREVIFSDIVTALDAICAAFEKNNANLESRLVKELVRAWSKGEFDD